MGEFQHNIDPKGRLIIPARFRAQLGETFVVTKGLDHCLAGYPEEEWTKLTEKIAKLPSSNPQARQLQRFFYASATPCEFDKQGRINISQALVKWAKLQKNCVIVGSPTHFEIWDQSKWEEANSQTEATIEEISEAMAEFGF